MTIYISNRRHTPDDPFTIYNPPLSFQFYGTSQVSKWALCEGRLQS